MSGSKPVVPTASRPKPSAAMLTRWVSFAGGGSSIANNRLIPKTSPPKMPELSPLICVSHSAFAGVWKYQSSGSNFPRPRLPPMVARSKSSSPGWNATATLRSRPSTARSSSRPKRPTKLSKRWPRTTWLNFSWFCRSMPRTTRIPVCETWQ